MWIEIGMWVVCGVALIGTVANIKKRRWCFHLWIITNAAWVWYGIYKEAYPQALLMLVYTGTSIWGLFAWKKDRRKEESVETPED